MSPTRTLTVLFTTCLLGLLPSQEEQKAAARAARPIAFVSLDFAGGTMAQFVRELRSAQPKANVALGEGAENTRVPALKVTDTTVGQALEVAAAVAAVGENGEQIAVREVGGGPGEAVYAVQAVRTHIVGMNGGQPTTQVRVFSLAQLTEPAAGDSAQTPVAVPVETILSAIESGIAGMLATPKMRYHQNSSLLFVQGDDRQLSVVREVLASIEQDQRMRRSRQVEQQNIERVRSAQQGTAPGVGK
ncbi:MAG: hypothetical protein IPK26_15525 [Planctomycetes bacterium]|nr:hypothetical protein [Planctomycetota bacterium]